MNNFERSICLVTSTRADYGIMSHLINMLEHDCEIDFKLIVTGMHLSKKFGSTYKEITNTIYKKIDISIEQSPSYAFSIAVKNFSILFNKLKPDIVILLGDRYETMAIAISAMLTNTPIAHLYGGDATFGLIDEAIRHSITKMSHLHFTSCEETRQRVIQLGESPERVFNFGALGVENIKKVPLMSKDELEKSIDFKFAKKNLLVTFHPVTLEGDSAKQFRELLSALDELKDTNIIITAPNSDDGNEELFKLIDEFVNSHSNVKYIKSLGMVRYLSAIQYVDAVVGNSSSGIYEVPSFKKPTINIGNRQKGRMQADSIINCKPIKKDILKAIKLGYIKDYSNTKNPYEQENTAQKIINIIKNFNLENILEKEFYNLES